MGQLVKAGAGDAGFWVVARWSQPRLALATSAEPTKQQIHSGSSISSTQEIKAFPRAFHAELEHTCCLLPLVSSS